jgi:hypothetical protein
MSYIVRFIIGGVRFIGIFVGCLAIVDLLWPGYAAGVEKLVGLALIGLLIELYGLNIYFFQLIREQKAAKANKAG